MPPETATPASSPTASSIASRRAARRPAASSITPTDGELLRMFAREPSDEAFDKLIDRHGDMVWRVCRKVLANTHDAEDAFQATFLVLARRARLVRASDSAAGWLYRVAFRTAVSAKRRARRRKEARLEEEPLAAEAAFPDLAGRETAAVMMQELDRMPVRYRTPLVLRYLEGRSRREIADQTDTTIAAVQGLLARGKTMLRSRLLRRGVSLSAVMAVVAGQSTPAEAVPTRVLAQTTSNATALMSGGPVAASAVVLSLYREGVRMMVATQLTKPAAAIAVALLATALVATPIIASEQDQAADESATSAVVLDTVASDPAEEPTEAIEIAAATPAVEAPAEEDETFLLSPGDRLHIHVVGVLPDAPINGTFVVERGGTVALGPRYGRVPVAGRSISDAEELAREFLRHEFRDPQVQITEAPLSEAPASVFEPKQPMPQNGAVVEYWPNGQLKSERDYEQGALLSAVEYAEDGQLLFEYRDKGSTEDAKSVADATPTPDEQLAEIERLIEQAEAYLDAADETTTGMTEYLDRGRQQVHLLFLRRAQQSLQQANELAGGYVDVAVAVAEQSGLEPEALIRLAEAAQARIGPLLDRIAAVEPRREEVFKRWNRRSQELYNKQLATKAAGAVLAPADGELADDGSADDELGGAELADDAAQANPPTEPDSAFAEFEQLMAKAEAEIARAQTIAGQVVEMRYAARKSNPLAEEYEDNFVVENLADVARQAAETAKDHLRSCERILQGYIRTAVTAATEPASQDLDATTEQVAATTEPLAGRWEALQQRSQNVLRSLMFRRQEYRPRPGVTGSQWTVYDKPSPFNPNGWAVDAQLAEGSTAPVGPVVGGARPKVTLAKATKILRGRGTNDLLKFVVTDSDGQKLGEVALQAGEFRSEYFTIDGERVEFFLRPRYVSGDEPDVTPFASLVIRQAAPETDPAESAALSD